jgi:hypothetical protein
MILIWLKRIFHTCFDFFSKKKVVKKRKASLDTKKKKLTTSIKKTPINKIKKTVNAKTKNK